MDIKTQNFLALDLELNNASDGSTPNPPIIQVGIAIGNLMQSEEEYLVKKWYLDPMEPIFPEITTLTGITDDDIKNYAVPHSVVAEELSALIKQYDCFVNPVTWGGGDSTELLDEFRKHMVEFRHFGRRWIDVKTWATLIFFARSKRPSGGLSSIMGGFKMPFKGKAHRADTDAFNTLRLFFHLIERQVTFEALPALLKEV